MTIIDEKEAKILSRIGSRPVYGKALSALMEKNNKVYAISADLGRSSGLSKFIAEESDCFINVGIAEQSMIGFSAGLAMRGFIPFASSFAPFATARCLDQIRMDLGYMHLNIKIVGMGSGMALGELGYSHYGLEDIAILRSIPGITIIQPADCAAVISAVNAAAEFYGPVYIRLTSAINVPIVYLSNIDFKIGKGIELRKGSDAAIIAAGSMVYEALGAAQLLQSDGIFATVIDMHTIPLDNVLMAELSDNHPAIVTVEEHNVIGGLGSAVSEWLRDHRRYMPHMAIGVPNRYDNTADHQYQLKKFGLKAEDIKDMIKQFLNELR